MEDEEKTAKIVRRLPIHLQCLPTPDKKTVTLTLTADSPISMVDMIRALVLFVNKLMTENKIEPFEIDETHITDVEEWTH